MPGIFSRFFLANWVSIWLCYHLLPEPKKLRWSRTKNIFPTFHLDDVSSGLWMYVARITLQNDVLRNHVSCQNWQSVVDARPCWKKNNRQGPMIHREQQQMLMMNLYTLLTYPTLDIQTPPGIWLINMFLGQGNHGETYSIQESHSWVVHSCCWLFRTSAVGEVGHPSPPRPVIP